MDPAGKKADKKAPEGGDISKPARRGAQGVKKKRKWVPEHKMFKGSLKEGQGFAFKRKQKFKHDYNKLLHKQRKAAKTAGSRDVYTADRFPEHLRHLYAAEQEKLRAEAWTNRLNRSKQRRRAQEEQQEEEEEEGGGGEAADAAGRTDPADPEAGGGPEETEPGPGSQEPAAAALKESLPMSNRMRKKQLKKTSNERTNEAFEMAREKRRRKKEEYLKNKQQREEAIQRYKKKKMESFQILSKKTKKGQPNLNLQMEYLLQKIQAPGK